MRQRLGQHFLRDDGVVLAMLAAVAPHKNEISVEIGPGRGVMTKALLERGDKVLAIEWDEDLANSLPGRFSEAKNLDVVHADIRTFDLIGYLAKSERGSPQYVILANLPYYLSSYFLRQVFQYRALPHAMVLLLQKEVAQRLCAQVGSSERSILSIMTQCYSNPQIILNVPKTAFTPPPKVDSAVVVFDHISTQFFNDISASDFFRVVKAGFAEKRKTILNALCGGLHLAKADVVMVLEQAGISPHVRAQDISLDQWKQLAKILKG